MMKPILPIMARNNLAHISSEIPDITTQQEPIQVPSRTQFGAIGWLYETPQGVRLFPLVARVMCLGKKQDPVFLC